MSPEGSDVSDLVPFPEALRFWVRLGFVNFGGPTGQIAIMHEELVDRRRWIDEQRFLHALNFAMLLPGPEAHQLAIYVGWLLNGAPGALAAGIFFLLPAFALIVALSWVYVVHGDVGWVSAIFAGLAWGVVGIVAAALVRIGSRALRTPAMSAIAVAAFAGLFAFGVPFPAVVLAAGALGLIAGARITATTMGRDGGDVPVARPGVRPSWRRALRVLGVGSAIWFGPLALVVLVTGTTGVIVDEAVFFSLMSLVTFGGAYAVLAYVNQAAVLRFGWLTSGEMAVGLSLAETTPGPLILVVVFVGFVAAFRDPGTLSPLGAGLVGAFVTAWATFVPSFLWIFLGAPSLERLRGNRRLGSALSAITAAVVGVIANLGVVFAIGVLFDERRIERFFGNEVVVPVLGAADALAIAVAVAGFVAIHRFRLNVVWVVVGSGLVGLARSAF
jgi:chromate transporter